MDTKQTLAEGYEFLQLLVCVKSIDTSSMDTKKVESNLGTSMDSELIGTKLDGFDGFGDGCEIAQSDGYEIWAFPSNLTRS